MANGMASLMVGATGLKSAQTALNTTAHNLANINTPGYTRQQISFNDTQYVKVGSGTKSVVSSTYGLGVAVEEIRRIRDEFIDKAYRTENSRLGYYSYQYKAIEEVEDQFGEMQGVTYQECLNNLYESINELSKEPSSTVKRSSLIQNASAFMTRSETVYKGLKEYQSTLNVQIDNMIDKVNSLANDIYSLNKKIAKIEAAGVERANDYRDERDKCIDELSEYISISYYETDNGEVMINAESVPFVTLTSVSELGKRYTEGTNLVVPTWPAFERDVYPEYEAYSVTTDKGALKGLMLARGTINVNYLDVPVKPSQADYNLTTDEGRNRYEKDYEDYLAKQDRYNKLIEPSVILSALAGLDKLVNGVMEKINNVLCPEKEMITIGPLTDDNGVLLLPDTYGYRLAGDTLYTRDGEAVKGLDNGDGTYSFTSMDKLYTDQSGTSEAAISQYNYSVLDMDKTDYGMDDDRTVGEEIFSRANTRRYTTITAADGKVTYVHNNQNTRGDRSLYTLGNVELNSVVEQDVAKIPMTTLQGKEDMSRGQELLDAWNGDFASINPEQYAVGNFQTFYNNFTGEFATAGKVLYNYVDHQQTMVNGYDDQRLMTEGVSSDEELEKMIKYQQAYNASSRYINVVSEMIEHLVTSLGSA